ncbi:MAG: hypothetical protein CVU97_03145 [Firmicutes bacterium HGW-Firmicutes-21]|nr:MAG: hypothetical protein CVU97_03145 [Firmicutes bacterium HGW-Firmicutes-21]
MTHRKENMEAYCLVRLLGINNLSNPAPCRRNGNNMNMYDVFNSTKEYFAGKKAIIFDMDGTLVDSMNYWYSKHLWSMPTAEERAESMSKKYIVSISPKVYAIELCKALKDAGIPFCIATNTSFAMAEPMLKKYGFDKLYDFYIDCDDVGAPKTSPDIYYAAAERLGCNIEEIVVFEDMPQSARTAKQAGFCVVGVYDEISKDSIPEMRKMCDDFIYNFLHIMKQK